MKRGLVLAGVCVVAAAMLGACGRPPGKGAESPEMASQNEEPAAGRHCHEERPTGSNIGRTVCRSDDDADGSREAARTFMYRRPSSPTAGDGNPTTGVPNSNP